MGMPCTGLMCVLTFFLELSLHKQQAVFTADLYIAFCGGKWGPGMLLTPHCHPMLGSNCIFQVVTNQMTELNHFLSKSQNVSSFFSVYKQPHKDDLLLG